MKLVNVGASVPPLVGARVPPTMFVIFLESEAVKNVNAVVVFTVKQDGA